MDGVVFQSIVSKLPLGVCVLNRDLEICYWNDFFASRLSFGREVLGKRLLELFPAQSQFLQKKLRSVLVLNNSSFSYWEHRPHIFEFSSTRPITGEETLMFQNLEIVPLEVQHGEVLSLCLLLQDVTEQASYFQVQKELAIALEKEHAEQAALLAKLQSTQNQLLHAEKMASIGLLASGIAHEINNPIGFIRSNLQTLEDYVTALLKGFAFSEKLLKKTDVSRLFTLLDDYKQRQKLSYITDDVYELIQESQMGAKRVSDIISSLRTFSHVNEHVWQATDLRQVLSNSLHILTNELKYKVQLHCHFSDDLPLIQCQSIQLQQVFMHLLQNSAQAIVENGDIWVTISKETEHAVINIRDNGCGMSEELQKRVFEPFFTTKDVGLGTGLGLTMVYNIVQIHRGRITLHSTVGVGSTFTIYLPLKSENDVVTT